MIRYLLDTDTFSYLAKRRFPKLQARYESLPPETFAISVITFAELVTGLEFAGPTHPSHRSITELLRSVQFLPWTASVAYPYAEIRRLTRKQPLQERDMMIAAHALAIDATLVTNNTKHFSRISPPLRIENWLW